MNGLDIDVELRRDAFELKVSASCEPGRTTAVFGANGSGKTSLLRIVAGLEPSATGSVRYRGNDWQAPDRFLNPEQREIGYVFQEGRLFGHLDVRRNLEFPARHGRQHREIGFTDTVDALDLAPLLERYPATLSGGERQRVAIGRALLTGASLLLMDEPLSSLDQARRRELMPMIRKLPAEFGTTILYVTHDLDELVYLADEVLLLAEGRDVARGSAQQILARSDFQALTQLEQAPVALETRIDGHEGRLTQLALAAERIRIPRIEGNAGDPVRLRVDPRDVILALERPAGISIRNCLAAEIEAIDDSGGQQLTVSLDVGGQLLRARITHDAASELGLVAGQRIYALIKTLALDSWPALPDGPQSPKP